MDFIKILASKCRETGSRFAPLFVTFSQGILLDVPCYILDGFGLRFGGQRHPFRIILIVFGTLPLA
jgi:hypothetical protein